MYDAFEEWKRQLSRIVTEINEVYGSEIILWDFSGYNSITTEALPTLGSERQMTWYRDPSHYRVETGQLMLNRMFGAPAGVPQDFGVSLVPETIDDYLAQQWQLGELYRARKTAELLTTPAL